MVSIQPAQIVYLEHQSTRLYTEAIQTAGADRLWARPLMLVSGLPLDPQSRDQAIAFAAADLTHCTLQLHDLRSGPDLVWPSHAFQRAFDTDFFSLLFHLRVSNADSDAQIAHHHFKQFLQSYWDDQLQSAAPNLPRATLPLKR